MTLERPAIGLGTGNSGNSEPSQGKGVVEPSGIEPPTGPDLSVRWRPLRFAKVRFPQATKRLARS